MLLAPWIFTFFRLVRVLGPLIVIAHQFVPACGEEVRDPVGCEFQHVEPEEGKCAHAAAMEAMLRSGAIGPAGSIGSVASQGSATDVLHYFLDIEVTPTSGFLGGQNTITVWSVADGLATMALSLSDIYTIDSVQVSGNSASYQRIDGINIVVTLDRIYNADEVFDIVLAYHGQPGPLNWGSIRYTTHGGSQPLVYTLSEPWYAYTWWPVKDDNTDKATGDIYVTVPDPLVVASNGLLQGSDAVSGGRHRFRWHTDYQTAPYLFTFSVANYNQHTEIWSHGPDTMPVILYAYPEDDTQAHYNDWLLILDMLDVYSDRYGVYPFLNEKYALCQTGYNGGMEHQTITGQRRYWDSTWEWINAHELGHHWWGDLVTCATWHDIWLNEGFATYSEALWYENKSGSPNPAALHAHMAARRPSSMNGSVYVYDTSSVGVIFSSDFTYRKGAWVLHQLRHVVGDTAFFQILADYRAAFGYSSATTADFQDVAESVTGQSLDWFFQPVVYEIGAPAYQYGWRNVDVDGAKYVELHIAQTQVQGYPIYTMPLDIWMTNAGGTVQTVVWNSASLQHYLLATSTPVTAVQFDPNNCVLRTAASNVAFVEGPPKVASTYPLPGASLTSDAVPSMTISFQKDVVVGSADVTLVGQSSGSISIAVLYQSPNHHLIVTPECRLEPDHYTLTIDDTVGDSFGNALDGELSDSNSPASIPSGDGLQGGTFVMQFEVGGVVPVGDFNGDGYVDQTDHALQQDCFLGPQFVPTFGSCVCTDLTGNGTTDVADFITLQLHFTGSP